MHRRTTDARSLRTRKQLGRALGELMQEKPMNEITIQQMLDRAGVVRSTFYRHFEGKEDLLLSIFEGFLGMMSEMLIAQKEDSRRIVAVTEFFAHARNQEKFYRALIDCGRVNDFYELAQGYFTRSIEQRLRQFHRLAGVPQRDLNARSAALSGTLLSLLRWWLESDAKESPEQMDALFHNLAWRGLR